MDITNTAAATSAQRVAATWCSDDLRHVRDTLNAEMMVAIEAGETVMTQALAGRLELAQACADRLHARHYPAPPHYVHHEGTQTLSFAIRVF